MNLSAFASALSLALLSAVVPPAWAELDAADTSSGYFSSEPDTSSTIEAAPAPAPTASTFYFPSFFEWLDYHGYELSYGNSEYFATLYEDYLQQYSIAMAAEMTRRADDAKRSITDAIR